MGFTEYEKGWAAWRLDSTRFPKPGGVSPDMNELLEEMAIWDWIEIETRELQLRGSTHLRVDITKIKAGALDFLKEYAANLGF